VPMRDHRGELVGVLQLMNRRGRAPGAHEPYPDDLVPLLLSLATQAAVCLKANNLTASIRKLFEDFARAAIVAVEQRDPTTAGHSNRVSTLSVTLAGIVDRAADGPYAAVTFSREELREIGTAALLHDFGKISIPERVLVKAKKLSEEGLGKIRDRFDFSLASEEAREARALLERRAREGGAVTAGDLEAIDMAAAARTRDLEALFEEIVAANEPTVLPKDAHGGLEALLARAYRDRRGRDTTLLLPEEFRLLSITQGSLSEDERRAVESHVSHTWRFLSTIPWTADLARVPEIAYAHHEKLDGTGYPRGLNRESIPPAVRALTVCDVYDALTASDRPYKKAVPPDAALGILEGEARRDRLDSWMVAAFIEGKVWTSLAP
ncbi:MAG: HD-GYP domain-containing protein, partial [Thermoanaerobaculia bacterium]